MSGWMWCGAAVAALLVFALLRRPLRALGRVAVRSGLGMVLLWLVQWLGVLPGVQLGVNLFNGVVFGVLGVPGLALLMMIRWAAG